MGIMYGKDSSNNRRVMTWVPPYALSACMDRLAVPIGIAGMKDGLTHLGLQFWTPTKTGGVALVTKYNKINDSKISEFRNWGHAHNIRVMLCIYNGVSGSDWELASAAFDTHREDFINALVKETLRLKLDGVDVDLEGLGSFDSSKETFVRFIKDLSGRLHQHGKQLTLDSFAYKWNAPNRNWWPELLPFVDGLTVMGYTETGVYASDWKAYDSLKAAAGKHAAKLLIGMPSDTATWLGTSVRKHLNWVVKDSTVGLAIWDAQLKDPIWRTKAIWEDVSKIRKGNE